jgi:lysozyme family protein
MYTENFERIVEGVRKYEGGYVNHPNDRGGPTNMGITKPFYAKYLGVPASLISTEMIQSLTWPYAKMMYYKNIWLENGLDQLPEYLQEVMMNYIVISGPARAIPHLQRFVGAKPDGEIGPNTLNAIKNKVKEYPSERLFVNAFIHDIMRFFIGIVQGRASQIVFLKGWFNRFSQYYQ